MLFRRKSQKNRKRHHAWLYAVVFTGRFSAFVILLLFASFLIQPFHKALAAESTPDVVVEAPPVAEDVKEQVSEEPAPEPESVPIEEQESTVSPEQAEEVLPDPSGGDSAVGEISSESEVPVDPVEPSPQEQTPTPESEEPSSEETGDESDVETPTPEIEEEDIPSASPDPNGTSTQVVQVENLVTEDNYYQFSKESCVEVGGGTFHCSTNTEVEMDTQSVAYASKDEDGDMEVFVKTSKGKVRQITDNSYDDTSPNYDPESVRVVWQRLIDGRYQIVLYDIMDEKETQLTFSKTNNMEPKVSDAGIVWQAWDGHDWEIMLFDGSYTEQLTDNDSQDVAPVIQDGYVLWNVLGGEEQQARVYSIETKETTSIVGYEGGSIVNPRFVLVYDTEYPNGDVITQSFDPTTGLSEPVAAKPAQAPIEIPESDPVGEIRALIAAGKSKDEKQLLDIDTDTSNPNNNASSTDGDALNLKQPDAPQSIISTTTVDMAPEFELTEYDLVIPEGAFEAALSAQE